MFDYDVVIIGAGAAGLMCAAKAGARGRKVLVLEHANKVGKKILMSGGGRCNFTNMYTGPDNFISHNPHFCKSALSRYTQWDFIELVNQHKIPYHEKKLGQLFCDNKSRDIVAMLLDECQKAKVKIHTKKAVTQIVKKISGYQLATDLGPLTCESLVIATGGLSIPTMGASGFGYDVARQFSLPVYQTRASLVPFIYSKQQLEQFEELSGISTAAIVSSESGDSFSENILFTHRGLSGPAILQISNYWQPGQSVVINLLPELPDGQSAIEWLSAMQSERPNALLSNILSEVFAKKLAAKLVSLWAKDLPIKQFNSKQLTAFAEQLSNWSFKPAGTEGYRTAEVTLGGIDTDKVSSKTMATLELPDLYFIGEVLDVTGHLGGFNFQWAWSSAVAAAEYV